MKKVLSKSASGNYTRDILIRAICDYTNDPISKVLPFVKKHLKDIKK